MVAKKLPPDVKKIIAKKAVAKKIAKSVPPVKKTSTPKAKKAAHTQGETDTATRREDVFITPEIMQVICDKIGDGLSLVKACKEPGMPTRMTFFRAVSNDKVYEAMYRNALALRGELFAEEITEDAASAIGQDAAGVNARRLVVDTKKWVASRLLPKKYGDRIIHTGDEEAPVVMQLTNAADALLAKIRK